MKVFFCPAMVIDAQSYSPSAAKPGLAVASWQQRGFALDLVAPAPVTPEQLARAHDPAYVDAVLAGRRANGFGNRSPAVAASLRYTSGALVAATREALAAGGVACAPVSGFHHAGYDFGGGFCTFNGLMVAALEVLRTSMARRVGILDCDMHYGNGTDHIIRHLHLEAEVTHYSAGEVDQEAEGFLQSVPLRMRQLYAHCDVLIYQAGADPHRDDPLGGWMTTAQLARRDALVFQTALAMGLPVAWNLAGGYQRDADGGIRAVLDIHDNTMAAALGVAGWAPTVEKVKLCRRPSATRSRGQRAGLVDSAGTQAMKGTKTIAPKFPASLQSGNTRKSFRPGPA